MLGKRILAIIVMLAIGLPAIFMGGVPFALIIALILGVAAWEYGRMFKLVDFNASFPILVGGVVVLLLVRAIVPQAAVAVVVFLILAAMVWHLVDYERGRDAAASDFMVTVTGLAYLGWIGGYLADLRNLPDGMWWMLTVLPVTWVADGGAYLVGRAFGKTQFSPRLSPKKTWEGFWGGAILGTLAAPGLVSLYQRLGGPVIPFWQALLLGVVLATLPALGDLGESMFKRQAGVKDSSQIIPGHGGVFDRIDSWLWAAVLGYYLIRWLLLKA